MGIKNFMNMSEGKNKSKNLKQNKNSKCYLQKEDGKINAWDKKTGIQLIKNGEPTEFGIKIRMKKEAMKNAKSNRDIQDKGRP